MIRVMVVDDEKYERRGIIESTDWTLIGCEVVGEASNGEMALQVADETRPQLVISDIRMPRMDGLALTEELMKRYPYIKVIFLTAHDEFTYAQKAVKLGVSDYLLKPFEDGELEASIQRLLHLHPNTVAELKDLEEQLIPLKPAKEISNRYISEALEYIENNYSDRQFSISRLAESLSVSEGHIARLFKSEMDISINNYLTRYRIRRAMDMLKDIHVKVYEVAERVGYMDIAYFSNTFKKLTGISPSDFQLNGLSHLDK